MATTAGLPARRSLGRSASKLGLQATPWAMLKQEFYQNPKRQSVTSMTSWLGLPTQPRADSPPKPPSPPPIHRTDQYIPVQPQQAADTPKVEACVHRDEEHPLLSDRGSSESSATPSTESDRSLTWTDNSESWSKDGHQCSMSSQCSVSGSGCVIEAPSPFDSQCSPTAKKEAPTTPLTTSKLRGDAKPWTMPNLKTANHSRQPLDSDTLFTPPPAMLVMPWQNSLQETAYHSHLNTGLDFPRHVGGSAYAHDVSVFAVPVEPSRSAFPQASFQCHGTQWPAYATPSEWTVNNFTGVTPRDPAQEWQEWADEVALLSCAHDGSESMSEQSSDWDGPTEIELPDAKTSELASSTGEPVFLVGSKLWGQARLGDSASRSDAKKNQRRVSQWAGLFHTSLAPPAASVETVKPHSDPVADAVPAAPEQPIAFDAPSSPPAPCVFNTCLPVCDNEGSEKYGIALTAPLDSNFTSQLMKYVKTVQKPIEHGGSVCYTAKTEGKVVKSDTVQDLPILMKGAKAGVWRAIATDGAGMKKARPKEYGQVKILSRKKEDTPELLPWTPLVDTELLKKQFPIPDIVDEATYYKLSHFAEYEFLGHHLSQTEHHLVQRALLQAYCTTASAKTNTNFTSTNAVVRSGPLALEAPNQTVSPKAQSPTQASSKRDDYALLETALLVKNALTDDAAMNLFYEQAAEVVEWEWHGRQYRVVYFGNAQERQTALEQLPAQVQRGGYGKRRGKNNRLVVRTFNGHEKKAWREELDRREAQTEADSLDTDIAARADDLKSASHGPSQAESKSPKSASSKAHPESLKAALLVGNVDTDDGTSNLFSEEARRTIVKIMEWIWSGTNYRVVYFVGQKERCTAYNQLPGVLRRWYRGQSPDVPFIRPFSGHERRMWRAELNRREAEAEAGLISTKDSLRGGALESRSPHETSNLKQSRPARNLPSQIMHSSKPHSCHKRLQ